MYRLAALLGMALALALTACGGDREAGKPPTLGSAEATYAETVRQTNALERIATALEILASPPKPEADVTK